MTRTTITTSEGAPVSLPAPPWGEIDRPSGNEAQPDARYSITTRAHRYEPTLTFSGFKKMLKEMAKGDKP